MHPDKDHSTGSDQREQGLEPCLGLAKVVKYANAVDEIERSCTERYPLDFALDEVHAMEAICEILCPKNCPTKIQTNHPSNELGSVIKVTTKSAAVIEPVLSRKKVRRDRMDEIEEVFTKLVGHLAEDRPLRAEALASPFLQDFGVVSLIGYARSPSGIRQRLM